jgi:hypothetical protein
LSRHGEQVSIYGVPQLLHDGGETDPAVYTPLGGEPVEIPFLWTGTRRTERSGPYGEQRILAGEVSFRLSLIGHVSVNDSVVIGGKSYAVTECVEVNGSLDFARVQVEVEDAVSMGRTGRR